MKKIFLLLVILLQAAYSHAQFGTDVIIEQTALNQRKIEMTTAFNGWIFTAVSTKNEESGAGGITIRKSTDGGKTWTTFDEYSVADVTYTSYDILVTGNSESELLLFLSGIKYNQTSSSYTIYVDKYNANTNTFLGSVYRNSKGTARANDVKMASDYKFPGVGTNPYSVALLYSVYGSKDSIVAITSIDGGVSFSLRQTVATTNINYFRNVALDYMKSASGSNGRYIAVWEQLSSFTNKNGNIYTSRTTSTVASPWIAPICLDSLNGTAIGKCKNPKIAVQQNIIDNDSASNTAIVIMERDVNNDGSNHDIIGFYNKRAHYTNYWYPINIKFSTANEIYPDILYENDSKRFHMVYFDSTIQKLNYMTTTMNFEGPNNWTLEKSGLNDTTLITKKPSPAIAYIPDLSTTAIAWIDEGTNGKGIPKIDVMNFSSLNVQNNQPYIQAVIYPNPVKDNLFIRLNTSMTGIENTCVVTDLKGSMISTNRFTGTTCQIPTNGFSKGMYLIYISNETGSTSGRFMKE